MVSYVSIRYARAKLVSESHIWALYVRVCHLSFGRVMARHVMEMHGVNAYNGNTC
jgi:hypothetical protein